MYHLKCVTVVSSRCQLHFAMATIVYKIRKKWHIPLLYYEYKDFISNSFLESHQCTAKQLSVISDIMMTVLQLLGFCLDFIGNEQSQQFALEFIGFCRKCTE